MMARAPRSTPAKSQVAPVAARRGRAARDAACARDGRRLAAGLVVAAHQRAVEQLVGMQDGRHHPGQLVAVEEGLHHRTLRPHLMHPHHARQARRRRRRASKRSTRAGAETYREAAARASATRSAARRTASS